MRRIGASIAAGQGSPFPTFFVWHRPDLSEFVVCRLEDWAGGSRKAFDMGRQAFADLIGGLPGWEGVSVAPPSVSDRYWESRLEFKRSEGERPTSVFLLVERHDQRLCDLSVEPVKVAYDRIRSRRVERL
jgi:hypothetical protein